MLPRFLTFLAVYALSGCVHESKEIREARAVYWMAPDGGLAAHVGSFSNAEVDRLRMEIGKMSFPVKEVIFRKLLPPSLKPKTVMNWDNFRGDDKGRFGGIVEDYWLNESSVLRVATAYYYVKEESYNCMERAEIIDPAQAYSNKVDIRR